MYQSNIAPNLMFCWRCFST